ncbi:hypothetical protein BJ742DRAFT_838600 [Cladochytrium replicatum]|nr:hypothetical protein BJ742DRAFT_838600 [Cladochytrium replicatum]
MFHMTRNPLLKLGRVQLRMRMRRNPELLLLRRLFNTRRRRAHRCRRRIISQVRRRGRRRGVVNFRTTRRREFHELKFSIRRFRRCSFKHLEFGERGSARCDESRVEGGSDEVNELLVGGCLRWELLEEGGEAVGVETDGFGAEAWGRRRARGGYARGRGCGGVRGWDSERPFAVEEGGMDLWRCGWLWFCKVGCVGARGRDG